MLHARQDYNEKIQCSEDVIPKDEPVFLLRAKDRAAVPAVRAWIEAMKLLGGDPRMIKVAEDHVIKMEAWPEKHVADMEF